MTKDIVIKYFYEDSPKLEQKSHGNWIDMYACQDYTYTAGTNFLIDLGVAMILPEGYEALVAPRSSTFKHYGLIQTNTPGIIDNTYCGDNDKWFMSCIALRDGSVKKGDRVCQMRIIESQPSISFNEQKELNTKDRGGYGSTGK